MAERGQLLSALGFDREVSQDLTLQPGTLYHIAGRPGHPWRHRSGGLRRLAPARVGCRRWACTAPDRELRSQPVPANVSLVREPVRGAGAQGGRALAGNGQGGGARALLVTD